MLQSLVSWAGIAGFVLSVINFVIAARQRHVRIAIRDAEFVDLGPADEGFVIEGTFLNRSGLPISISGAAVLCPFRPAARTGFVHVTATQTIRRGAESSFQRFQLTSELPSTLPAYSGSRIALRFLYRSGFPASSRPLRPEQMRFLRLYTSRGIHTRLLRCHRLAMEKWVQRKAPL